MNCIDILSRAEYDTMLKEDTLFEYINKHLLSFFRVLVGDTEDVIRRMNYHTMGKREFKNNYGLTKSQAYKVNNNFGTVYTIPELSRLDYERKVQDDELFAFIINIQLCIKYLLTCHHYAMEMRDYYEMSRHDFHWFYRETKKEFKERDIDVSDINYRWTEFKHDTLGVK